MIWSKEALATLTEESLCRDVLIPLFEQIGFHDVHYYHGGSLERGKDIVMWAAEPFGSRLNYVVVAKATDIKGGAKTQRVQTVTLQIQQSLNSSYSDPRSGEERHASRCLVVTSGDFPKETRESIRAAIGPDLSNRVEMLGADELWSEIEKHLAERLILSRIRTTAELLNSADPEWGIQTTLYGTQATFQLVPKVAHARALPVEIEPRFPDTPEGKQAKEEYTRALRRVERL